MTVRSDELFYSAETSIKIFNFLQLEPPERSILEEMIRKPVNKQPKKNIAKDAVTSGLLEQFTPLRSRYFG
ncbi:MAG: hypothetical protein U5K69_04465 [Balneolaceae bacterium]|nr:hypothetical protein [Balneolaceae bacterium]